MYGSLYCTANNTQPNNVRPVLGDLHVRLNIPKPCTRNIGLTLLGVHYCLYKIGPMQYCTANNPSTRFLPGYYKKKHNLPALDLIFEQQRSLYSDYWLYIIGRAILP